MDNRVIVERMRAIREWVHQGDINELADVGAGALVGLTRLSGLQERVANILATQTLREQPFTSRIPVVGPLIVRVRSAWNWMSTRWYVLPLLQQQNAFNAAVARAWADLIIYLKTVARHMGDLYSRLDSLELRVQGHESIQPRLATNYADRIVPSARIMDIIAGQAPHWCTLLGDGPVVVFSCGQREIVQALSELGLQTHEVDLSADAAKCCGDSVLDLVCSGNSEYLSSLPEGTLGGVIAFWTTQLSTQSMVRLLVQCQRALRGGAWVIWIWPWAATSDDTQAQMARNISLGLDFRVVQLEAHQFPHLAFQALLLQK